MKTMTRQDEADQYGVYRPDEHLRDSDNKKNMHNDVWSVHDLSRVSRQLMHTCEIYDTRYAMYQSHFKIIGMIILAF